MSNGSQRRSPLFAGILLILLGLIFLLNRYDPGLGLGHLIHLYWPLLVILWGVTKLIDHRSAQKTGDAHGPLLSGGEAALLIVLALVLASFVFRDWLRTEFPGIDIRLPSMGRSFSRSQSIPPVEIAPGAHIAIDTERGDIKIVGVDGNELRVGANSSATGGFGTDERLKTVNAVIDRTADGYRIHPTNQGNWSRADVDFDIQVPKTAFVAATTSHGDINVDGVVGGADVRTQNGDVRIQDAGGNVSSDSQKGDVHITRVHGNVLVHGGGDDVEIADVSRDVTLDGAFLGDTKVDKAGGTVRIRSARSEITLAQLTGDLALDSGDLSINGAGGATRISTRDKDITLQGIEGRLDIANSHGDIELKFEKPPRQDVSVTNDSGDVSVTMPSQSAFQISAESRSGEVECDFDSPSFHRTGETDSGRLNGVFGNATGGPSPKISIATSYGTIHLKKSH